MTGRKGLTGEAVVDAATAIVDEEGTAALTLSRVAQELGVKPPSLYNHISGLATLQRDVALRATENLGNSLREAAMGRAGSVALREIAKQFRSYVIDHPGLYELSAQARPDDQEYAAASMRAAEPVIAILREYDLDEREAIHATRLLRAALHGFVSLEMIDGFGLDVDADDSFSWIVESLARLIESHRVG